VNIPDEDKELDCTIRQMNSVLMQVLKSQARPETVATVEQLQHRFAGSLSDDILSKRWHLQETVEGLDSLSPGIFIA
jgi:hypothetical protein